MKVHNHMAKSTDVVALLKACAIRKDLLKGSLLHAEIVRTSSFGTDVFVGSALVNMYVKCGALIQAHEAFSKLTGPNIVAWNALITGYAQYGRGKEALHCFEQMCHDGIRPDAVTLASVFKACGTIGAVEKGHEICLRFAIHGLPQKDTVVGTALVDMYAKCGMLQRAEELFNGLAVRNIISWTALLGGFVQHGCNEEALVYLDLMEEEGISPNAITFVCVLKACSSIHSFKRGQIIHVEISRRSLLKEECISTALVDMYCKCGLIGKAEEVFRELHRQNVESWNALISGYAQTGVGMRALDCFKCMQNEAFCPDAITFSCLFKACSSIGTWHKGQELHSQIYVGGFTKNNISLSMGLIDMYAKFGIPEKAERVFESVNMKDVMSWNAVLSGYAQSGEHDKVFELFVRMIGEGEEPDSATFVSILTACNHDGLLDEGQICFEIMSMIYNIIPSHEHHACLIDLLSRVGRVDIAVVVAMDMPFAMNLAVCHMLLGACQKEKDTNLGLVIFHHVIQLDEDDGGAHICMRNIFADNC